MHRFPKLQPALLTLARSRHGVIGAAEMAQLGLDRTRVSRAATAHLLGRVGPQTYAVPSMVDPFTPAAAVQLRHPDLVLERRTAAAVWGLDGYVPRPGSLEPLPVDVARPDGVRRRPAALACRAASIPDEEIVSHAGFRVTSVAWTLADLGSAPGATADLVEIALESRATTPVDERGRPPLVR